MQGPEKQTHENAETTWSWGIIMIVYGIVYGT